MWEMIDGTTDTMATEIPGVGCVMATPGVGMVFVPRTRLVMLKTPLDNGATHVMQRDERSAPPIKSGLTADDIREQQGSRIVDPGAAQYYTQDDPDY